MDVHVRNSCLYVTEGDGQLLRRGRVGNTLSQLAEFLGGRPGGDQPLKALLERTTNSWAIQRMMLDYGKCAGVEVQAQVLDARKLRVIAESVSEIVSAAARLPHSPHQPSVARQWIGKNEKPARDNVAQICKLSPTHQAFIFIVCPAFPQGYLMNRDYLLDLASRGLRMPIGTDLLLHENSDAEAIRTDGKRLGEVIVKTAQRYRTPLAIPLMDLTREKAALLELLGIEETGSEFHFSEVPDAAALQRFERGLGGSMTAAVRANTESVRHVASTTDLIPMGLSIGPFSLLTKLLADPITPVYLSGAGASVEEEPELKLLETLMDLSTRLVLRVIEQQIDAGAKMIVIAEPAANKVFVSPTQIAGGSDVFERIAMAPNRRIAALLKQAGVELFFHCCGELIDPMVQAFGTLDPAILSLGSSRLLWHDATLVPNSTVLYGNLPSKQFYSDSLVSVADVGKRSRELIGRMKDVSHPFILGTECDVLSVPGCEHTIKAKVDAMLVVD